MPTVSALLRNLEDLDIVRGYRAVLADRLSTSLACFECKGPIRGEPVKVRRDGRYHYFCCRSCERLYLEKHGRIKAPARGKPRSWRFRWEAKGT